MKYLVAALISGVFSGTVFAEELRFPQPEILKKPSGLQLVLFNDPKVPVFDVQWVSSFGEKNDPVGKSALSELMIRTILREPHLRALEAQGISVFASSSLDSVSLGVHALSVHKKVAFENFEKFFKESVFSESEMNFEKSRLRESWKGILDHSDAAIYYVLQSILLSGTPYSQPIRSAVEQLDKITIADIRAQFLKTFARGDLMVVGVGDVSMSQMEQLPQPELKTASELMLGKTKPRSKIYSPFKIEKNTVGIVHRPFATQVDVRLGWVVPQVSLDDIAAASVIDALWVGYFESRLNRRLRDELGLTYGVNGQFQHQKEALGYSIQASTQTASIAIFLKELKSQLELLARYGPTLAEVEMAKKYLLGSIPLSLSSLVGISHRWISGRILGYPDNYLNEFVKKISQVDILSAQAAVAKYFRPKQSYTLLVMGDRDGMEKVLKSAGFTNLQEVKLGDLPPQTPRSVPQSSKP